MHLALVAVVFFFFEALKRREEVQVSFLAKPEFE